MNDFKEWVSDYLRYILLGLAALLLFGIIFIGVQIYRNVSQPAGMDDPIQILPETEMNGETEPETAAETDPGAQPETESDKESDPETQADSETEPGDGTDASLKETGATDELPGSQRPETEERAHGVKPEPSGQRTASEPSGQSAGMNTDDQESEPELSAETLNETEEPTELAAQEPTEMPAQEPTEMPTEEPTEPEPVTEIYVPVYKTLQGSCYIRSGPSYEAEIIGEYQYGTVVEFLEDVGGWYKVQIDGMIGYMGARFF